MATHSHTVTKVVKLDRDIKERLDRLGVHKRRSPHWLMKEAIVRYLEQEEHNERVKQETLIRWKEAENGKIVSHEAMIQWLDTWGDDTESKRPPCEA